MLTPFPCAMLPSAPDLSRGASLPHCSPHPLAMRLSLLLVCAVLASLALATVNADVYINSPRGSNNRLDEANRDRANGDRLFDSQVRSAAAQHSKGTFCDNTQSRREEQACAMHLCSLASVRARLSASSHPTHSALCARFPLLA